MNITRARLAFVVGGVSAVFNATSAAFFAAYQPADERATLTVAAIAAVNVGLATAAAYLRGSD